MLLACSVMRGFYPNNWRLSPVCDRPDWTTSPGRALLAFVPPIQLLDVMSTGPQVTLTSDFFNPIVGDENEANPGRFGKALAQWLARNSKSVGYSLRALFLKILGG